MIMTYREYIQREKDELKERREKEQKEIEQQLSEIINFYDAKILDCKPSDEYFRVDIEFTLFGYTQKDEFYWRLDESIEEFSLKTKQRIEYIKELRERYPVFCEQNDFIQSHSNFAKKLTLTHMGYKKELYFNVQLADYLKLPNTTSCGFGGGDYEIKRTPKRVKEYNKNIDRTIEFLIDCIAEIKTSKCPELERKEGE